MSERPESTQSFDAVAAAKRLMRTVRYGTLATLDASGAPYASLVNVASDIDGTPITLISRLALHTRNIEADGRVSLLLATVGAGDPSAHPRISIAARAEKATDERARRRFLMRHPGSAGYAGFPDFAFYRLVPTGAHLVAGFGRIVDLAPAQILLDLTGAEGLVEGEASAVDHMNEDHSEALALYATRLLGEPAGDWRTTGLDPEGIDLMAGDLTARLIFPERIGPGGSLRATLVELARQARARDAA
ncbi:pyridoxamine 5'-phosphate oxidase family protein [Chelatococcus sp. SYSU_G07232]|uniref:Pyridoxamine 5'-phosphate oxidase family protein n=1 Tax=Chelatococcus albus TaxID=3047466 RepID=A0ABT7AM52_9HYPH|nr:pyridoxamine 5'-phosphate oxidase family protein [Chelatococcus sp. SYSU_G07232]MDJ1160150.1 pyridoxamine 5'-phosphate oxidase family protein [Chelatococcus sp. SYSU_G07232]